MSVPEQGIEYDDRGRMLYHPEFHPNQGKRFSDEETAYLCKFYETDTLKSLSLALGRLEKSLEDRIAYLKKKALFDYYRAKWERQINAYRRE
ncbi:hypothetical protein DES34_112201 [Brevibacillus brevis]|nr:DNA-entry nuclease [Brevibacillus brevis]RED25761.1 hypothetical protein DES34_112201 [Brevibacillus brevis]GEC93641.1 hypothetical protein BBR01nite_59720 [Brevibacillus brevis]VEF87227.1 Uncharacterised protein [Brevibacillus brevis]